MAAAFAVSEALLLGLASGPACIASCGPVLVPSLLAERAGVGRHARFLSAFLATRLLGYLIFAAIAWEAGTLLSFRATERPLVFAGIHLLLGCVLLRYAYCVGRGCGHACSHSELVTIGSAGAHHISGAAVLGFLTGVSVCPPFLAAGVRAAELASLAAALLFFAAFFLGTSAWFLPFAGLGWMRRNEAVITVARMAMALIGLYYFYAAGTILAGRGAYGI